MRKLPLLALSSVGFWTVPMYMHRGRGITTSGFCGDIYWILSVITVLLRCTLSRQDSSLQSGWEPSLDQRWGSIPNDFQGWHLGVEQCSHSNCVVNFMVTVLLQTQVWSFHGQTKKEKWAFLCWFFYMVYVPVEEWLWGWCSMQLRLN